MTTSAPRRNGDQPFIITRTFNAPRAVVWRAWTDPQELVKWFGPKGSSMVRCTMDLRPGGIFHYCLRIAGGLELWGKWTFREVVAPEKLVLLQSFSDAQGGISTHPMAPTWPRETLSHTTFTEHAGQTTMALHVTVWNGTDDEHATFDGAHGSMTQGWGGTLDRLTEYLATHHTNS
jgi:uncharacterized protein YndB with AHSA1/START domain